MVLPWNTAFNALAYGLKGSGFVGAERLAFKLGQAVVFGDGDVISLEASANETLDVILLGGAPIGEPVEQYGPFVMNTREE